MACELDVYPTLVDSLVPVPPPLPVFSASRFVLSDGVPPPPPLPTFSSAAFFAPDAIAVLTLEKLLASCPICYDELPAQHWTCSGPTKHSFCNDCMRQQVLTLMQGQTTTFCCPSCRYHLSREDLLAILKPEDLLQLQKMGQMIRNHKLKECPQCTALVLGNPSRPAMVCHQCSLQFCYFHGLRPSLGIGTFFIFFLLTSLAFAALAHGVQEQATLALSALCATSQW
jgi:hypothetical protein